MINNMGSSHTEAGNAVVVEIWEFFIEANIWLTPAHLPGSLNLVADQKSRRIYGDS